MARSSPLLGVTGATGRLGGRVARRLRDPEQHTGITYSLTGRRPCHWTTSQRLSALSGDGP
jgi:hypothetical protein